jgi:hypothetical protein
MFKFLFEKVGGKAKIETQRGTVVRTVEELNSVLAHIKSIVAHEKGRFPKEPPLTLVLRPKAYASARLTADSRPSRPASTSKVTF